MTGTFRYDVIEHIRSNARKKDIILDHINGYTNHIHCLISLKPDQTLAKVIQLLKGESSYWINQNKLLSSKFEWADEYYGASVCDSHLNRVREYIRNQEQHHQIKTWEEEYEEFITRYNQE